MKGSVPLRASRVTKVCRSMWAARPVIPAERPAYVTTSAIARLLSGLPRRDSHRASTLLSSLIGHRVRSVFQASMARRHSALSGTVRERRPLPLPHREVALAAGGDHC